MIPPQAVQGWAVSYNVGKPRVLREWHSQGCQHHRPRQGCHRHRHWQAQRLRGCSGQSQCMSERIMQTIRWNRIVVSSFYTYITLSNKWNVVTESYSCTVFNSLLNILPSTIARWSEPLLKRTRINIVATVRNNVIVGRRVCECSEHHHASFLLRS